MSMTKNSAAYQRWAEEQRDNQDDSYQLYLEAMYLAQRKVKQTNDKPQKQK